MTTGLSHRIGSTSGSILFAGMKNTQVRSGAMLPGGGGLGRYEDLDKPGNLSRMPVQVVTTWERKPSVAPVAGLQSSSERVTANNNWTTPVRGGSSLRMPAARTLNQRAPVKILPMITRLQR